MKTAKLTKKQIEERNRNFAKMSLPRKRVAIAKDVLAQLAAGKYIAEPGTYLDFADRFKVEGNQIQSVVEKAKCTVCGIGAIFCSAARFADKITTDDIGMYPDCIYASDTSMLEYLSRYFDETTARNIEGAFEIGRIHGCFEQEGEWVNRWLANVFSAKDRLRLIMENIIYHKGEFKELNPPTKLNGKWVLDTKVESVAKGR